MDDDPALVGLDPDVESLTVTVEVVAVAEELANLWLSPTDLAHAAATVAVIREMPGIRDTDTQQFLEGIGWLHAVLADGESEWGEKVSPEWLAKGGMPPQVILAVRMLTRERWRTPHGYARTLDGAPDLIKIVACASRIAKLREVRESATTYEWAGLVYDTTHWLAPITFDMPPPWGAWLRTRLEELSASREARTSHE